MVDLLRESRRLDEELKKMLNNNLKIRRLVLKNLRPSELLDHMDFANKEEIAQDGNHLRPATFLTEIQRHCGWGKKFLDALCRTRQVDLAKRLKPDYKSPVDHDLNCDGVSVYGEIPNSHVMPDQEVQFHGRPHPPSYEEAIACKRGIGIHERDQINKSLQFCSSNNGHTNGPPPPYDTQPLGAIADQKIHHRKCNEMTNQLPLYAEPPRKLPSQQLLPLPVYSLQMPKTEPDTLNYDTAHIESSLNNIANTLYGAVKENARSITDQNSNLRISCLDRPNSVLSENLSPNMNSLPNLRAKVLRKQTRNDLSSNRNTSNHQSILSVNETFSMNNPEEDVGSTNTISASKARHSELPDQSCLKEEANGETENSYLPFHTVSYHCSTERSIPPSKEITPSQLKVSVESQPGEQNYNTNESYHHGGERTPILVSDSSNEDPLENLSRSLEEKLITIDTRGNGTNQNTSLADNTEANPESSDRILESLLGTVNAIPIENREHDSNEDLINLNPNASIVPHNEDNPVVDSQPHQSYPISPLPSGIIVKDSFGKSEACCKQSEKGNDPKPEITNSDKSKNVKVDFSSIT